MRSTSHPIVVPFNDLARGIARDRKAIDSAISEVLSSGHLVLGLRLRAFETQLASFIGVKEAIGVASGTDALELSIRALMPERRSAVLTAANAGGYTATAARRAGFGVRWADVDATTFCLTPTTVAESLTDEVGVVVVTHLYGRMADAQRIVDLCADRGVMVVEDCAQALGASTAERRAGSFGHASATSFYPTKNLGALGDGGAIMTNLPEVADRVRLLRQYGWTSKYHVSIAGGVNSRLDEIQAAILSIRLPDLDRHNARRRAIVDRYRGAAAGSVIEVAQADGPAHVAHLAVAVAAPDRRDSVRAQLSAAGIATDIHFPVPDHRQPGFAAENVSLPTTEDLARRMVSVPCFSEMTDAEIDAVCVALASLDRIAA